MTGQQESADVIIVGGGIIGCTLGFELQRLGFQVLLLDKGAIGREATWASAGILGAPTASRLPMHRAELAARSARSWNHWIQAIEESSGMDSTYIRTGKVLVARTEAEVEGLQGEITWQHNHGFVSTWLERDDAQKLEPLIPDDILGAYFTEDGGAMTLHRFTESVAAAFLNQGGTIREHTPVDRLIIESSQVRGVMAGNERLLAPVVVLSAGAWTGVLALSAGFELPTIPVKGQMISVAPGPGIPRPGRVIGNTDGGYLVPRVDGTVAIGASREHAGFDTRSTPLGLANSLHLIHSLGPALLQADFVTSWAGLRPGTRDDTPIMGPVSTVEGLWISSGHYRTGAQLAPASAELVAAAISGQTPDPLLDAFSPNRFQLS